MKSLKIPPPPRSVQNIWYFCGEKWSRNAKKCVRITKNTLFPHFKLAKPPPPHWKISALFGLLTCVSLTHYGMIKFIKLHTFYFFYEGFPYSCPANTSHNNNLLGYSLTFKMLWFYSNNVLNEHHIHVLSI